MITKHSSVPTVMRLIPHFILLMAGVNASSGWVLADAYEDRLEKAVSFYGDKHFSEAAALLQSLVESEPDKKDAWLWLGKSRAELQDWNAARTAYKKYVDLAPQDVEGSRGVALTYESEGNKDLAVLWYRKAQDLEPRNEGLRQKVKSLENEVGSTPTKEGTQTITSPDPAPENQDVWHKGIAGILGARKVWWGKVIAVVLFVGWLLSGAQQSRRMTRYRMPNMPEGAITIQLILSTAFFYIIYWGIPITWGWALMVGCIIASVSASKAAI